MRTIRSLITESFTLVLRQWRITAIVYFIQFCLLLTLGMQVHGVWQSSIGNSLEINKLLTQYDHTVLMDFLKIHGASITPLIGELRWLLLFWLLFSVFIDAGLLVAGTSPQESRANIFWQGGAQYFFPFLKIALFFLLLALLWTAVIWLPLLLAFQPSLEYFTSEKYLLWLVLLLLFLYLAGLVGLFVWSVTSRLIHLKTGKKISVCLRESRRIFRQKRRRMLGSMAVFLAVQVLVFLLYNWLESISGMTSPLLILLFFILQQAFVFFRIQIRQMLYAALGGCLISH